MFRFQHWSKRRRILVGSLAVVSVGLVSMVGHAAYRHHTLPERVAQGHMLFEHEWQPHDALSGQGDGLGPVFNEKSCVACHFVGGTGGSGPAGKNVASFEVLPGGSRDEILAGVVHASAVNPEEQETRAVVSALFPVIQGGQTVIEGCITKPKDFDPVITATINSPALFGAGLIDGLSGWSIHGDGLKRSAQSISRDLSADFSSIPLGKVRTLSHGRVGKFGWKGQFATLGEFVASACAVEIGLTNPKKAQHVPGEFREDTSAKLDMTARQLDQLITYVASLPRPVEILPDDPAEHEAAIRGKLVFSEVGCAECHTPDLGNVAGVYSDFRLYEVEPERQTSYTVVKSPATEAAGHPKANEWKTPPLWGVADSAPYFHDGASRSLYEAIMRHAGAAKRSRAQFKKLPPADRDAVIAFLNTLRSPVQPARPQPTLAQH